MTTIEGAWDVTIATPIGRIEITLEFRRALGELAGVARGRDEATPLSDIVEDGDRVTWRQRITKPMRLNLDFDVSVRGDVLSGTSRAGRLPSSRVSGVRAPVSL